MLLLAPAGPSGAFDHRWRSPYLPGPPASRCAKLNSSESKAAPHTNVRRIVSGGPLKFISFGGGGGSGANAGVGYSFSQQPAYEKALTQFGERQTLVLDGLSRWSGKSLTASYPSLLDHASPRLGRALGDAGSIEDGDNYMLTDGDAELYVYFGSAGDNILRRRVHISSMPPVPPPPPPSPLPADCATLLVSGAGRASANGLYHRVPGKTSDGAPLFQTKDTAHQIRRVDSIQDGHIWQLAPGDTASEALYMSSPDKNAATLMPPTNGWRCDMATKGERVVPAPASVICSAVVVATVSAPPTAQQHLVAFWDFQEPAPPYANKAPATAGSGNGCDLRPFHFTDDTNPKHLDGAAPEPGAAGMIDRAHDSPGVFGEFSAHLHGNTSGDGAMLMVERESCPHAYISGPNATLSLVVWYKHPADDAMNKRNGVDNFGHAAGVWNEDSADRQYVIYPRNGRIHPYDTPCESIAECMPEVGAFLDVEVSSIGGNTPGQPHSITFALGNTTLRGDEWQCMAVTYDSQNIGAWLNGVLDVRSRSNRRQAGADEIWENPYPMSAAYPGAPGGVYRSNGTFSVGAKAGALSVGHDRPGPSRAKSASRSLRRALLTRQVNPGSRYRCGKRT